MRKKVAAGGGNAKLSGSFEVARAPVSTALLQTTRRHLNLAVERLRPLELVPPQELIVMRLAEHGASSHSELSQFLGRDRSTITNTLQAMDRAGLIVRAPHPEDGRSSLVSLSERGSKLYQPVRDMWTELERATTAGLSAKERAVLVRLLGAVQHSLREAAHDGLIGGRSANHSRVR